MSLTTSEMTPADISALCGNADGFGNGAWWIIILFLFVFMNRGGYGFGGSGDGASANYVLASDFATLQRQISDSTNATERKLDAITNGLCEGFYTEAQLVNGVNQNITNAEINAMQNANAIQSKIAECCCANREAIAGVNYNMSMNANAIQNSLCSSTRDIIENQNANTRAITDLLISNKIEAKNDRIAELERQLNYANLSASQLAQNETIISRLSPMPYPAYIVPNPNCCNSTCGC